ncbi:anthrone oxygenase family protein [Nocardioides sp. T2.26MG-1]|uniref:anthrone oxygenase family protein n=1 Tax=Nocardioides sp. T2.26MG-1 TaxID=3041166 RepID=UPI0024776368|nr:anthrone oxygenase family protein [Nocardioides sp. T2.26MG-1]CAI9412196.1 hypothetical protein HIDPHFAB_01710 [Nocardioides sp. T2.26MG-1]
MNEILETLRAPALLTATVAAGLQAGTYYTWASGVMPGLARTDDRTFVHTMQQMNIAIVNPVFMATFLGAPLLAGAAVLTSSSTARPWVIAGLALAIGTVAITAGGNIPLNNALDAAGAVDRITDLAGVRADFEDAWVRWNVARAVTSTASLACLAWAAWRS